MDRVDDYGFANVNYWDNNIPTFKGIFVNVHTYIPFTETGDELFQLFKMIHGERLIFKQYPTTSDEVTAAVSQLTNYCSIFARTYSYKYIHMLETEKAEYNPIENYSMTEKGTDTRTPNLTNSMTSSSNTTESGTETRTPNLVTDVTSSSNSSETGTNTSATVTGVTTYDDTADFINQNKGTDNTNSETTAENTVTQKTTASGKEDTSTSRSNDNTATEKTTTTGTEKTTHEFKRSGNIGVTTSQQMIQSEREVADFSALAQFVTDIANIICLSIY